MKLWLLRPIYTKYKELDYPWEPRYDKTLGFVVRAETEEEARKLAAIMAGDEREEVWLEPRHSTCVELTSEGTPEVVIRDFASA